MEVNKPLSVNHFQKSWPPYKKEYSRKSKKIKVTKSIQRKSSINSEDGEDIEVRNQRHMDVLRDLARLRDHYYSVYLSKLESKVAKQRKAILAREEKLKKKLLIEEEKKRREAHIVPHRLPKVELKSDSNYLQKVPKSRYYHLVAVEELMKNRGLLKHKYEVDDFWKKAQADQSFWVKPIPASISPDTLTEHMLSRYSSQTTTSKLVLDQALASNASINPLPGILKKSTEELGNESEDDRESNPPLVFPEQPKFPNLHSFNANFTKKRKSNISNLTEEKPKPKHENVEHNRRQLSHHLKQNAYEVAVVNTAMSRRLLHRRIPELEHHEPLSELTEIWCKQSDANSVCSTNSKKKDHEIARKRKKINKPSKVVNQATANEDSLEPITEELPAASDNEVEHQPLSMDMMLTNENFTVKDAKISQKVWVNYARHDDNFCIKEEDESPNL